MAKKGQRYPYRVAYVYPTKHNIKGVIPVMTARDAKREAEALEGRGAQVSVYTVVPSTSGSMVKVPLDDWKLLLKTYIEQESPDWMNELDRLDVVRSEAKLIGDGHGYSHANRATMYGDELKTEDTVQVPEEFGEQGARDAYVEAFLDGQDRYRNEQGPVSVWDMRTQVRETLAAAGCATDADAVFEDLRAVYGLTDIETGIDHGAFWDVVAKHTDGEA